MPPGQPAGGENQLELTGRAGTLVLGVAAPDTRQAIDDDRTERWEQRLDYRVVDGEVALLLPGISWQHFTFPEGSAWLKADVSRVLDVIVVPAGQ